MNLVFESIAKKILVSASAEDFATLSASESTPGAAKLSYTVIDSTGVDSITIQRSTDLVVPSIGFSGGLLALIVFGAVFMEIQINRTRDRNRGIGFLSDIRWVRRRGCDRVDRYIDDYDDSVGVRYRFGVKRGNPFLQAFRKNLHGNPEHRSGYPRNNLRQRVR